MPAESTPPAPGRSHAIIGWERRHYAAKLVNRPLMLRRRLLVRISHHLSYAANIVHIRHWPVECQRLMKLAGHTITALDTLTAGYIIG